MSLFYASPTMLRRWVAGRRFPGVWLTLPSGRSRCVLPMGHRVTSVYGRGAA